MDNDISTYAQKIDKIESSSENYSQFERQMIEASLYHLFPEISEKQYDDIIRKQFHAQKQAVCDQYHLLELLSNLSLSPNSEVPNSQPSVYVASHTGSYRLILPYLISIGLKITVIIDSAVADVQQQAFEALLVDYCLQNKIEQDSYEFLSIGDPSAIIKMAKAIKRGRSALIYLDGNLGMKKGSDENLHKVPFLGTMIQSRLGPARIAEIVSAPLRFISISRSDKYARTSWPVKIETVCNETVRKNKKAEHIIEHLWQLIEDIVVKDPAQWEALRYVDRFLDREFIRKKQNIIEKPPILSKPIRFDSKRFKLIESSDNPILIDRQQLGCYRPSPGMCNILKNIINYGCMPTSSSLQLDTYNLEWLMQRGILIT